MTVEYYQRQMHSIQQEIARLQDHKGRAVKAGADEMRRAGDAEEAGARVSSPSMKHSKAREAQRHRGRAVKHQQKVAEFEGKIAREHGRLLDASKHRDSARVDEGRKRTAA